MHVNEMMVRLRRASGWTVLLLLGLAVATLACSVDPEPEMADEFGERSATVVEPSVEPSTIGEQPSVEATVEPSTIVEQPSEPSTIVLAIDTSLSMLAEDTPPATRFVAAKAALDAFVDEVSEESYVGLVSFSGITTVLVEPTTDRSVLRSGIGDLELGEATAIGEAIFVSIESIESFIRGFEGDAPPATILLLSDGETTVGRPDAAGVDRAQMAGISVSTIAFGTDRGTIELPEGGPPVPVPANRVALASIAAETGGQYFEARTTIELIDIFRSIGAAS